MAYRIVKTSIRRTPAHLIKLLKHFGLTTDSAVFDDTGDAYGVEIQHADMTQDTFRAKLAGLEYVGASQAEDAPRVEFYKHEGRRYQIVYLAYSWAISEAERGY